MIVSVDFDGTITQSSDPLNSGFNKIRPGCKKALLTLHAMGVEFRLLTGRRSEWISEAVNLCKKWELPIETDLPNLKRISDFYIDDRNLGCGEIDWKQIQDALYQELGKE